MENKTGWKTKIEDNNVKIQNRQNSILNYKKNHKTITLTFKNEDYELILKQSKAAKQNITSYYHGLILNSIGKYKWSKTDLKTVGEINKIGININQMQKHINIHSTFDVLIIAEFNNQLKSIYQKLIEIRKTL